jgi:nicotinamide-nucleotide amidase
MDVEIITVGYEILEGDVLDTNSNWMAKEIAKTGNKLRRVTIIEDDIPTIAECLTAAMARKPSLILVSGGLGPTKDDLTLEGVARVFGVGLAENGKAMKMVAERYADWNPKQTLEELMTEPRRKMAIIPDGSEPVYNPVGTAPGVLMERNGTRVLCLPGVPGELKAIFTESVLPLLGASAGEEFSWVMVKGIGESELATHLNQAMDSTGVEIRSYPSRGRIRIKVIGKGREKAIELIAKSLGAKGRIERLSAYE